MFGRTFKGKLPKKQDLKQFDPKKLRSKGKGLSPNQYLPGANLRVLRWVNLMCNHPKINQIIPKYTRLSQNIPKSWPKYIEIIPRIKQNHPSKPSPKPWSFFLGKFPKTLREIPNHLSRTGGDSAARSGSGGIVDVEFGEVLGRGSRCTIWAVISSPRLVELYERMNNYPLT